jgi:hypothetical protein
MLDGPFTLSSLETERDSVPPVTIVHRDECAVSASQYAIDVSSQAGIAIGIQIGQLSWHIPLAFDELMRAELETSITPL